MGPGVITLDTSGLFASLNRKDRLFTMAVAALTAESRPFLVPAAVLGELAHFIESRSTPAVLDKFLADMERRQYVLDCGNQDLPRVRELVKRYADLPLGFVDAAVIACAERNGGRVLTFDLRHFGVVAREGTITIVP